jgi:amino acid adenylation domain-containing protein
MNKTTIVEFISHLKSLDVQLFIEGDYDASPDKIRLRCNAPEGTLTSELRQELVDSKAEIVAYLHQLKLQSIDAIEKLGSSADETPTPQEFNHREAEPPSPRSQVQPGNEISRCLVVDIGARSQIQPTARGKVFPLSFAQQRLWFLYQLAPDNPFYNIPAAIRLRGTIDIAALERSLNEIVRRHAALRTTFTIVDGQPVQVVESDVKIQLSVVNLSTVVISDRSRISQQLATAEAQSPFNLTTDPLLRVTLVQFDLTEAVLLLTMHHIVADGWSLGVLIRELAYFYTAFVEGKTPVLQPLPIQYADFACWQRNWLQGKTLEEQLTYWCKQLQDLSILDLPCDRSRPTVQTYRGATYPLQISPTLTQALEALSQQSGGSLFMTLLAAFQTLLYRYTGQEDIAIGSPIANRHRSEIEGLIGFFVNSLVLRSDLSGNPTFRELLSRVRDVALEAYAHQDLPFEKLVEELDPERDLGRNPLFQVAFALQNAPMQRLELPGLTLEPAPLESGSTRFDLEIHLWEPAHGLRSLWQSQEGLSGFISYSTDLFERDRISRLIGHFQTLLESIVANPDARLSDLPLLTTVELEQILVEWNQSPLTLLEKGGNQSEIPLKKGDLGRSKQELCFHQIFEAQVQCNPEAIAIVSEQESLTYKELDRRADLLAQTLQQMGVQPDSLVGLCVDRSTDMVIGILGILKAGGAYVPLDPNYPSDRLHFMLTDTQVSILLTQSWLVERLPRSQANILCLDREDPPAKGTPLNKEGNLTVTADNLAYVIYTSGSTGTPKGVLLSHRGLCNVVEAQQQLFHLSRNSRILQFSSLSFDASIFEIALAFGSGATLYIPPKSAQLPGIELVQFLKDNAITHALLTPAVLAVLPSAELPALQVLITGGETCSSQVIARWAANRHFFNAFGPTETTIWATIAKLHPGDNPLTIGHPILNTQVYILDANLNLVPAGIPGELYIGGTGVAQGYLNRKELTAERFIDFELSILDLELKSENQPNPKSKIQNPKFIRLYKTGDRARYRSDGTIEFLGRIDNQIKIRGFRVELGEIEATLQSHPAVRDAVAIASGETSSEMRLIAYFSIDRQYLQQTIRESLIAEQIQQWETLYNQTYQSTDNNQNFNITGWNSSYTGQPIPLDQMQEWVSDRVGQILALKPKRVLEIGCGTGLLLFQIAPHCQKYIGTDFSTIALESIQNQLDTLNLPQVELLQRMATDFEGIDNTSFDVVILNSIVQYFPSVDYLMQVLEKAIGAVASGGVLFLGDVRSLPLLTAFHTWVQFSQADGGMERTELQQRVERSQFEEPELTIDPMFFYALRDRFPQIRQVQIRLARGRSQNEMTQFRYNVLLHVQQSQVSDSPKLSNLIQQHNWKLNPIAIAEIKKNLIETKPERLTIANVTNSRVNAAVKTANWLRNIEAPKTVGRMRELLHNSTELALDPQDWWDLETVLPYNVEITWSTQTHTGDYDVLLIRRDVDAIDLFKNSCGIGVSPVFGPNFSRDQSWHHYTNDPLQSQFARQLIPELRQYLGQTLPEYMIPFAFVPLEKLPLNANGKVDRRALPTVNISLQKLPLKAGETPTPQEIWSQTESTLIEIWKELLRLKQVNTHDNFFELGGHSLLATQMTSRVRDVFGLELPLKSVFEAPTIAQLACILETLRDTTLTPKIPPLVRLDRSAYRRKRSPSPNGDAQIVEDLHLQASPIPNNPVFTPNRSLANFRSPLVPLTLGGNKQPFFCVHPMFGVVFPYLELAHYLGSDRSFYGLQPLGLDGKSAPLNRIEAIAAYYIQAIESLQPNDPYFLGGWSFGGLVAFEMAQQLTQAGKQVALLAILDTTAPCNKPSWCQSLKFLLGTALWSTLPFLLDYGTLATNRLQSCTGWFSRWQWSAIASLIPEESRLRLLDESAIAPMLRIVYANAQAAYRYVPQHYAHRIALFKATEQSDAIGCDPTLGWSALSNDIQLHQVPGNHLSLLKQPHVQMLAQQLGQYLL